MARKTTEHSGVMSDEGVGVRARRERLGIGKKELAEEAGVSRDTLAAIEDGRNFRRASLTRIERALSKLEEEVGFSAPPPTPGAADDLIEFRVEGVYGARAIIVKGPVRDIAELEASVDRIMRRLAQENRDA